MLHCAADAVAALIEETHRQAQDQARQSALFAICEALVVESCDVAKRRAASLVQAGDVQGFGLLMNESHDSLCNNFAVSTEQMDEAVKQARALPGVYGARMTGGGFGGCMVMVADSDAHLPENDNTWRVRAVGGAAIIS